MKNLAIACLLILLCACVLNAQDDRLAQNACKLGDRAFAEKQYERAIRFYDNAVRKNYLPAYFLRGIANHAAGKFEEAIQDFDHCIANNYKVDGAKEKKELAETEKKKVAKVETKTDYGSGINNEGMAKLFYKEGMDYYVSQNFEKAIGFFNSAISMNPNYADAYAFKALIAANLEKWDDLLTACTKAIELKDYLKDTELHQLYLNRGIAHRFLEKYEEAIDDFTKAIELAPKNGDYYLHRGIVYHFSDNDAAACSDWKKAESLISLNAKEWLKKYCK